MVSLHSKTADRDAHDLLLASLALGEVSVLFCLAGSVGIGLLLLSVLSALRSHSLRGLLFPFLDFLHIGLWMAGAAYAAGKPESKQAEELSGSLLALR